MSDVSYKVSLRGEGDGDVRRLKVSAQDRNSLAFLKEEIVETFPSLKGRNFAISWTDEDGDTVGIGTNNELSIALDEMAEKGVVKIQVKVAEEEKKKPAAAKKEKQESDDEDAGKGPVHKGISCDACKKNPIRGIRYKCAQCPNYDLCEPCFQKCAHPGHTMWKLANPGDVNNIGNSSGGSSGGYTVRRSGG